MKIGFTRSQIHNNTKRFNINAPSQDDTLTQCYAAEVHSKLSTPHEMPEDVKSEWTAISNAVKSSGFKHRQHVRWMWPETYEILPRKAAACWNSDKKERNRLKRLFDKSAMRDWQRYCDSLAN